MEDTSHNEQHGGVVENSKPRTDHASRLEAIDREQRRQEELQNQGPETQRDGGAFSKPIVEALGRRGSDTQVPLLSQEELDDTESPRVNWTAVICTAIIAASITIILCVAQPWNRRTAVGMESEIAMNQETATDTLETVTAAVPEEQPQEEEQQPVVEETNEPVTVTTVQVTAEDGNQEVKPAESTLPIERVSSTGTNNPYNNIRLINASERLLTKAELAQMSKAELYLARNAIYARHGYQFNNAELREFFSRQKWFKATDVKMEEIPFTKIELDNIRLIKAQEQAK